MIADRLYLAFAVVLVAGTMHLLPWLSRRERLFGVTVTDEFRMGEGRRLIGRYELRLLPWTAAAIAGSLFLQLAVHPFWLNALTMLPVLAAAWNVWRIFNRMPRTPAGSARMRSAELSAGPAGGWWMLMLLAPLAPLAAIAAYLHAHWVEIPNRYPTHWNLQGVVDGWGAKSLMDVYGPTAIGAGLVLMIAGLTLLVRLGGRRSAWIPAVVAIMAVAAWMVGGTFTMVGLLPLHHFSPSQLFGFEGAMLAMVAVVIVVAVRRLRQPGTPSGGATPDACWHGGIFYYNPNDPALLVEKRIGVGWTFNFARPLAWMIVVLILLIPAGVAVLSMKMAGK